MAFKAGADATAADLTTLGERELRERILARPLPRHVAIIMDGNGRWATSRGLRAREDAVTQLALSECRQLRRRGVGPSLESHIAHFT